MTKGPKIIMDKLKRTQSRKGHDMAHHISHYEQQYNHFCHKGTTWPMTWQVLWAKCGNKNIGGRQYALLEFLFFQINQVDYMGLFIRDM
jgi:hypothetical protein